MPPREKRPSGRFPYPVDVFAALRSPFDDLVAVVGAHCRNGLRGGRIVEGYLQYVAGLDPLEHLLGVDLRVRAYVPAAVQRVDSVAFLVEFYGHRRFLSYPFFTG